MSAEQALALKQELRAVHDRSMEIANIVGPAFGAKWCDQAVRLAKRIQLLGVQVYDHCLDIRR
jgi:hypothetical protein